MRQRSVKIIILFLTSLFIVTPGFAMLKRDKKSRSLSVGAKPNKSTISNRSISKKVVTTDPTTTKDLEEKNRIRNQVVLEIKAKGVKSALNFLQEEEKNNAEQKEFISNISKLLGKKELRRAIQRNYDKNKTQIAQTQVTLYNRLRLIELVIEYLDTHEKKFCEFNSDSKNSPSVFRNISKGLNSELNEIEHAISPDKKILTTPTIFQNIENGFKSRAYKQILFDQNNLSNTSYSEHLEKNAMEFFIRSMTDALQLHNKQFAHLMSSLLNMVEHQLNDYCHRWFDIYTIDMTIAHHLDGHQRARNNQLDHILKETSFKNLIRDRLIINQKTQELVQKGALKMSDAPTLEAILNETAEFLKSYPKTNKELASLSLKEVPVYTSEALDFRSTEYLNSHWPNTFKNFNYKPIGYEVKFRLSQREEELLRLEAQSGSESSNKPEILSSPKNNRLSRFFKERSFSTSVRKSESLSQSPSHSESFSITRSKSDDKKKLAVVEEKVETPVVEIVEPEEKPIETEVENILEQNDALDIKSLDEIRPKGYNSSCKARSLEEPKPTVKRVRRHDKKPSMSGEQQKED